MLCEAKSRGRRPQFPEGIENAIAFAYLDKNLTSRLVAEIFAHASPTGTLHEKSVRDIAQRVKGRRSAAA